MQPASKTQVGGDHYKNMVIQPVEFIHRNKIGYIEGSVIKYVCRHRSKNGRQDLENAKHFIDLLIEQEYGGVPVAEDMGDGIGGKPLSTEELAGRGECLPKFDPNAVIQPKIHTPTTFGLTGGEAALFEKVYGSSPEEYATRTDKRSFDQAWHAVREAIKVVDLIDADAAQAKAALAPKKGDTAVFQPDGSVQNEDTCGRVTRAVLNKPINLT